VAQWLGLVPWGTNLNPQTLETVALDLQKPSVATSQLFVTPAPRLAPSQ